MSIGSIANSGAQAYAQQRVNGDHSPLTHARRRHSDPSQQTSWTQAQNQASSSQANPGQATGLPSSALEPATATKVGQVLASSTSGKIVNVVA